MKKTFILLGSIAAAFLTFAFTDPNPSILGRWNNKQTTPNGPIDLTFVFRSDSTYDGSVNGKAFVTGKYFIKNDTILISDGGCNMAYYGSYKLKYYAKDSLLFTAISDTCKQRYEGANGLACKRVPKK